MTEGPTFWGLVNLILRAYTSVMPRPKKTEKDDDKSFVPSEKVKKLVDMLFGDVRRALPQSRKVPEAVQKSRDATKREMFAEGLAQGLSFTAACRFACVDKRWIARQTEQHPEFHKLIEDAYDQGTDYLEDLAFVKAHYSDAILIKLLEARRPEKFRAKIGSGGPQIIVNVGPLFPQEVKPAMKEIEHEPKKEGT